jgi:glycosyltransferase involved in cell wall biosynthesis
MKILYLYSEIMGYNLPIFAELARHHGAEVHVVHWDKNKLTPFSPEPISGVTFYARSSYTNIELQSFVKKMTPDLIYVSGWMDHGYLSACASAKERGTTVVVGFDSQWTGSLRQRLGVLFMRLHFRKKHFSFAFVPGPLQAAYARNIGFAEEEIIPNLLSADTAIFKQAAATLEHSKRSVYPQNFLYVGRFAEMKGIDILVKAFEIYKEKYKGTWTLTCIGNGPMLDLLSQNPDIITHAFMTQPELVKQASEAGAFILPSRLDPWGVVVHEFAAAGLPLILSNHVGAREQFLVEGQNGCTVKDDSPEALANAMQKISTQSDSNLIQMGKLSATLAQKINPSISAISFLSALDRRERIKRQVQ